MKRKTLFFAFLSLMASGDLFYAMAENNIVNINAIKAITSPTDMNYGSFLTHIDEQNITPGTIMDACMASIQNPEPCETCYRYVKEIVAKHNEMNKTSTPDDFQKICTDTNGKYKTQKQTYNQIEYDGEWCYFDDDTAKNPKCTETFKDITDTTGVEYEQNKYACFNGTQTDNYDPQAEKKAQTANVCIYKPNGTEYKNGTYNSIGCTPEKETSTGNCSCTCNNGKWKCVQKDKQSPKIGACTFDNKTYNNNSSMTVACKNAPANNSSLEHGDQCTCNCIDGKWGCYLKSCEKDKYTLQKHSYGYECKKKPCADVDKGKFEKVEEIDGKCKLTCKYGQVLNDNKTGCIPRHQKLFGSNSDYL